MYARRLLESGVLAKASRYEGMIHAFMQFPRIGQAGQALAEICSWLGDVYAAS